jgi:hypothetical protein
MPIACRGALDVRRVAAGVVPITSGGMLHLSVVTRYVRIDGTVTERLKIFGLVRAQMP